ncbi:dihydroxyacetone kinase subunit DhaL [Tundrisphaera sp. TA3]|uniref:dihydroxyacetone kinase subunit DhaL n=1 Tax=Tundrisphaera sp. TA3 TaxID=3435775 RepID=UPI003EBA069F
MKKLINDPGSVVPEMIQGLVASRPGLSIVPGHAVVVRDDADFAANRDRRVALISGGGSGHEPAHAGYVGPGMLSAAVLGDVFTSPAPDAVLAAIRASAGAAGALLIVKNYTGDRLNFGLAAEMARAEGIDVAMVIVADDVALAGSTAETAGARGLAGTILVHKVAGAAAEAGLSLAEVAAEARAAAEAVATMGVALSSCTVPAAGKPGFTLGEDEVELGLGIHGEPGVRRIPLEPADALVDRLLGPILGKIPAGPVALMINNLGGTPPMELSIVARYALARLAAEGRIVERSYVGTFLSALEMAGVSLSALALDDDRLARLDAPTGAPAWPNAPARARSTPPAPAEAAETAGRPTPATPASTEAGRSLGSALQRAAHTLIDHADRLTDLDQKVGDGDLGISLARGSRAVLEALPTWPLDDPAATLSALGTLLQRVLGGTSGPMYAMLAFRAASALRDDPAAWPDAFRDGVAGVIELGGARAGDRTMLDALIPASEALAEGRSLREAIEAAEAGAEATAAMMPRRGRSSYLGDRALGHPDPGAVAVALWLRAIGPDR